MRVIDFFVFYITTLYKNKRRGNLFWDSPIGRTAFIVGLMFTMLLFSFLDILFFLITGINMINNHMLIILIIILGVLLVQLLRYVYIARKRYEFITSNEYEPFNLGTNTGVTICLIVFFISIFSLIITGITIDSLIKK
jgi:hypothetical protein